MRTILAYFAKKSHNVRVQLLFATFHGLLSIFGFGGTIAIIMKVRKLGNATAKTNRKVS
jgi:hypothetical protein